MSIFLKSSYVKAILFICITVVAVGAAFAFSRQPMGNEIVPETALAEKDVYVRFVMEAYDSIANNYVTKAPDKDLAELFVLSMQTALAKESIIVPTLASGNRAQVAETLQSAFAAVTSTSTKKQMAVDIITVATSNLKPEGRNALFSQKQETQLRQNVSNIDPAKDLYKDLGVEKGSPVPAVEEAYVAKAEVLKNDPTPSAQEELKKITYAHKILTDNQNKKLYDESQIEPTVNGQIYKTTLYLSISKLAPTTLPEFGSLMDKVSGNQALDSMVIDLRGNIGGSLDFAPAFLGIFIGKNQYAFDLFHRGEYSVVRTVNEKYTPLSRFKEIAILTDNMTQSTAEVTTAALKRLRIASVIGTPTRGWGTAENTFPMNTEIDANEHYALFLVHSLTLRDDNTPIEGVGVVPDIDKNAPNFSALVHNSFRNTNLANVITERMREAPLR